MSRCKYQQDVLSVRTAGLLVVVGGGGSREQKPIRYYTNTLRKLPFLQTKTVGRSVKDSSVRKLGCVPVSCLLLGLVGVPDGSSPQSIIRDSKNSSNISITF